MSHCFRYVSLVIIAGFVCGGVMTLKNESSFSRASAAEKEAGKMLRHVVLFKFKEGTTDEQVKKIETAFRALPSKIDAIADFEWGTDVSVENKSEGFTHCFLVTFRDEQGRDEYLPHPAHKEFGGIVRPHLEKVLVVDYWSRK
jgi:hypothetical protein